MLSTRHAKHAKPALHPTRTTLSTGLTAVLLPLCMASPALAGGETTTATPSATSTATTGSEPTPAAAPTASPAPAAKQTTTVRISGPRGSVAPGSHAISVRLLADDRPVKNGYVRVEKKTASGWAYAGRLLTNADGLGAGKFSFPASTRLRAVYQGAATRTAATSSEIVVKVVSFRQQALNVAAQQNGKPYSYGSDGPNSFDCSGLVRYAFSKVGRNLPHSSSAQASETQRIAKDSAQPGDLIFISSGGRVSHVGVYAGGGMFWDAPTSGGHVSKRRIWTSSYSVGRVS